MQLNNYHDLTFSPHAHGCSFVHVWRVLVRSANTPTDLVFVSPQAISGVEVFCFTAGAVTAEVWPKLRLTVLPHLLLNEWRGALSQSGDAGGGGGSRCRRGDV